MNDDELRNLQERVQIISDLASSVGWAYAMDRVVSQVAIYQNRLILGKAKDYEEYIKWVAYTDGLSFVLDLPKKVQEELERELARRDEETE